MKRIESSTEQSQKVPWGVGDVLLAVGLALAAVVVIGMVAGGVLIGVGRVDDSKAKTLVGLAATLPFEMVLLGLVGLLALKKYRCSWRTVGFRIPKRWHWYLPMAAVFVLYAVIVVYVAVVDALGLEQAEPQSTLPEDVFDDALLIGLGAFAVTVVAPLAEEAFFRGFMFSALRDRWGVLWGALVSGLLFALAHADPGSVIPFTLIGVVLAGVYTFGGSLWYNIAAHFLFNAISFTAAVIAS